MEKTSKNKKVIKERTFYKILLALIILTSVFLRVYKLNKVPVSLSGDELDVGYHAYSLLKTGRDYMGQKWPTYLHSLSEWRLPLFIYSTIPFIKIFGLNEFGVRFSSVFFGVLSILMIFMVCNLLFKNNFISLISSFLLAFIPWHIHYSRIAFEVSLLVFLFLIGLYFFIRGLSNPSKFVLSAFFFLLTIYTYSTAILFLPMLAFNLLFIYRKEILSVLKSVKGRRWLIISVLLILVMFFPMVKHIFLGQATGRFNLISIFSDQKLIDEVIIRRSQDGGKGRFFHNKAIAWGKAIVYNYMTAFSPQFLFLFGDSNPRHNGAGAGVCFLVLSIFIIAGFLVSIQNWSKKSYRLILFWLFFSPLPSSLTQGGGNHATRLFLMLPPLIILAAIGVNYFYSKKRTIFLIFSLIVFFLQFIFYFHFYYHHYPKDSWQWWQYGYKEAFDFLRENKESYNRVFVTDSYEPPLIRFLFWTKYDPELFHQFFNKDQAVKNIVPGYNGFQLENYYFGSPEKGVSLEKIINSKDLYLASFFNEAGFQRWDKESPAGLRILKTIYRLDGQPLFFWATGITSNENNK